MRRRAQTDVVPEDLQNYIPARWIQDALTHGDPFLSPRLRALTPDELLKEPYMVRILGAARYRAALWAAVGQRVGDGHYYGLDPSPGLTPLVRADS